MLCRRTWCSTRGFFFNDTATTEIYTLSLHDALPISETRVYVSAASAWEICTKVRLGKLPGAATVADDVVGCVRSQAFTPLDISIAHAQRAGRLTGTHRDPFDRMLVAQALSLDIAIVSNERRCDRWGGRRLWKQPG